MKAGFVFALILAAALGFVIFLLRDSVLGNLIFAAIGAFAVFLGYLSGKLDAS